MVDSRRSRFPTYLFFTRMELLVWQTWRRDKDSLSSKSQAFCILVTKEVFKKTDRCFWSLTWTARNKQQKLKRKWVMSQSENFKSLGDTALLAADVIHLSCYDLDTTSVLLIPYHLIISSKKYLYWNFLSENYFNRLICNDLVNFIPTVHKTCFTRTVRLWSSHHCNSDCTWWQNGVQ